MPLRFVAAKIAIRSDNVGMGIAAYIKEIGRGKEGARSLTAEQAHDLFSQVLDDSVTDLETGAFALAMRIKGETPLELQGFLKATHERCIELPGPSSSGVIVLPSYNGARKLPNLTPLLAAYLAQQGLSVLVHGPMKDPTRVTTAEVWSAMGWEIAQDSTSVSNAWSCGLPAFMPIDRLCPGLAKLLEVRWTIGLRNPGHTVAKLLRPWCTSSNVVQVVNHTHPEYAVSLTDYLQLAASKALLLRGTEGEPVADARRQPRFDVFIDGVHHPALSRHAKEGVLQALPQLPNSKEPTVTAAYIQRVLAKDIPLPDSISQQAQCLASMLEIS